MGDTSMLCRLSMTSALRASWRAAISLLEHSDACHYELDHSISLSNIVFNIDNNTARH